MSTAGRRTSRPVAMAATLSLLIAACSGPVPPPPSDATPTAPPPASSTPVAETPVATATDARPPSPSTQASGSPPTDQSPQPTSNADQTPSPEPDAVETPPAQADRDALAELANLADSAEHRDPEPQLLRGRLQDAIGSQLGPQEVFESPGGASFTWQVPERYSIWTRAWQQIGTIDVAEPTRHTQPLVGYQPSYVFPDRWPVTLDGCRSKGPGSEPSHFSWTIRRGEATVAAVEDAGCLVTVPLPEDGTYEVTLDVRSDDGWRDTLTANIGADDIVILSLGDSSASGEGNPDDTGLDVGWVDQRCHRSTTSGHALTAQAIEASSDKTSVTFLSFACSGAKMRSGVLEPYAGIDPPYFLQPSGRTVKAVDLPSQIDQARAALCRVPVDRCGPGDMRQVDFIFLSAGINDLAFSDVITVCANLDLALQDLLYVPVAILREMFEGPCSEDLNIESTLYNGLLSIDTTSEVVRAKTVPCDLSDAEWEERLGYVPDEPPPYCFDGHRTFGELRRRLEAASIWPTRGVFLSSYPVEPFATESGSTGRGCGIFRFVSEDEAQYLTDVGYELNELVHREAVRNGFYSVPGIVDRFRRHGYCAGIQDDGQVVGPSSYFVGFTESLVTQLGIHGTIHPNRRGHEAIRDAFLDAIAAQKPERAATHRVTVTVSGIRFDVPPGDDITGNVELFLLPFEVVADSDEDPTHLEVVAWKRRFEERVVEVSPGQWLRPQLPALETTLASSDAMLEFGVWAHVTMPVVPFRTRPIPPDHPDPIEGPVLDPGATGYYLIRHIVLPEDAGWATISREPFQRRQSGIDFGSNPGSMTVEFCLTVVPIGATPRGPQSLPACREDVIEGRRAPAS